MTKEQLKLLKSAISELAYCNDYASPDYNRACHAHNILTEIRDLEEQKDECDRD